MIETLLKIYLPKLGESILHATVIQWFKKEGDWIERDEPLLEVSTDKVNSEIPSPFAGKIESIQVHPGQEAEVGQLLATVSSLKENEKEVSPCCHSQPVFSTCDRKDLFSPSVFRLLKEKGIDLEAVDQIPRTGTGGRLTKRDVEGFSLPVKEEGDTERVKMSALRKAIADNMVRSFYEAPHASLATEVDVTRIVKALQEKKEAFQQKHGVKLTITAFVAQAIARALQSYPLLNASLEGDTILVKRFINLGVAVSVSEGVIVPVIRDCHRLELPEIAKQIAGLALKARERQLHSSDVQEGTITMTNFGMTGTMIGVPIIRYPEVAIVGLGAITRKVVPMPDDSIAIRSILWISLTFDHRVLDGLYGCGFLSELKKQLEQEPEL
ncbi:MAG TPA: dihydrolipoamide acetyltransferase family protein [Chlamydiales bacterium]|nr:dihydrolipoamide acetyltransferase family protein [Chlamydiales bacterium]